MDLQTELTAAKSVLKTIKQAFQPAPAMPDPSMASGMAPPQDPSMVGGAPPDPSQMGAGPPPDPSQAGPPPPQQEQAPQVDPSDMMATLEQITSMVEQMAPMVQQLAAKQGDLDKRLMVLEQGLSQPDVPAGAQAAAPAPAGPAGPPMA